MEEEWTHELGLITTLTPQTSMYWPGLKCWTMTDTYVWMTLLRTWNSFHCLRALGRSPSFFFFYLALLQGMAAVHQGSSHFKRVAHLARLFASPSRNNVWGGNIWMLSPGDLNFLTLLVLHRDRGCTNQILTQLNVLITHLFATLWTG